MSNRVKDAFSSLTSKFNHFYLIPLFGLICWYALCFGLMGKWIADGAKSYPEYDEKETPLPLERVGMILLPGFFITFIVLHAIIFCISMYLEYYHRKIGKLIKFIKPTIQKRLAYASLVVGIIAQIFLIAQAVSGTVFVRMKQRQHSHYAVLLATFAILIMISLGLNFTNYYIMGQYYKKYVNGERWNKFTISFVVKITWLVVTIVVAVVCCIFYVKRQKDISSILEWVFHFWYGLLLAFWTYDLYPLTELRALRRQEADSESYPFDNRKLKFWSSKKFSGHRLPEDNSMEKTGSDITAVSIVNSTMTSDDSSHFSHNISSPVGFNFVSQYEQV